MMKGTPACHALCLSAMALSCRALCPQHSKCLQVILAVRSVIGCVHTCRVRDFRAHLFTPKRAIHILIPISQTIE